MEVKFVHPKRAYQARQQELDAAWRSVNSRGAYILQADGEEFESRLAHLVGKKHAIGVNSGTDALYLSLWALGIKQGDEVITSAHTFVASAQVIAQLGATPVLVDCHDDLLMHEEDVRYAITDKTKAIIPIHLTGDVSRLSDDLLYDLKEKKIHSVEDACQALGAKGLGYGITQCWSFYPFKILGSHGDAGAITTDDDALAAELRELRNHYKKDYSKWGINSRLDNIQAAILNVKIKYIQDTLFKREQVALKYREGFKDVEGLKLPEFTHGRVWQDFIIRTSRRDELYQFLKESGIETMKNDYPMPIPKLENAIKIESETLRIPCNEWLKQPEVEYVIEVIKSFYEKA